MPKLSSKLVHHLLEYHGVDVLAEHVEEEPVADEGLLHDGVDHFSPYQSEADVEQVRSHLRAQDDDEPIQDDQRAQKRQQDEPEEEKRMNFMRGHFEEKNLLSLLWSRTAYHSDKEAL